MELSRRAFLSGAGVALAVPRLGAQCRADMIAGACREPSGEFAAIVCDADCGVVTRVPLPARGHDIALRPGTRECVVFARRPGRFAVAFAAEGGRPPRSFEATEGRHFFGHGVFSPDGRLLFSTEDDIAAGRGVIGVRDATDDYRHIGEFASGGVGPHDLALLPDGRTLIVANGGVETGGGREKLNIDSMESSFAYVDARNGDLLEAHGLAPSLQKLSIRHLGIGRDGVVVFGCQHEGAESEHPPLIGFHRRGEELSLMEAPEPVYRSLRNYVGSVAVDCAGELAAATSPRGGVAMMIDIAGRRAIGERRLADVCGVAPRHQGGGFVLTSGFGDVARLKSFDDGLDLVRREDLAWDNHAVEITGWS